MIVQPYSYQFHRIWSSLSVFLANENSWQSNRSCLLLATAGFSGLCSNLNTPVPIDIGIPIMMHSLTPRKGREERGREESQNHP